MVYVQCAMSNPRRKIYVNKTFKNKIISSLHTWFFHDGCRYHIETSPLICCASQWTGFYMIMAFAMKELKIAKRIIKVSRVMNFVFSKVSRICYHNSVSWKLAPQGWCISMKLRIEIFCQINVLSPFLSFSCISLVNS